jgi:phenolphthiocerol/phthiocerol/phthiodiolone dimycocerosyl transferase
MIRQLAPSELYYFSSGTWVSYTTVVDGPVDAAAMIAAGTMLQSAYPMLAARITSDDEIGPALVLTAEQDDDPAFISVWNDTAEAAVTGLGSRTAGVRIRDQEDGSTAVALLTSHAVADAQHSLRLLVDLWSMYTDIVNGLTRGIACHPYPLSMEALLTDRGVPAEATRAGPEWEAAPSANGGNPYGRQPTERIRLSVEETCGLIAAARREGTTVNGLVSATLMQACSETFGAPPLELLHRYPVDFRPHLSPKVGATEGTTVLGQATYTPATDCFGDLYGLARDVSATLKLQLANGVVLRASVGGGWADAPAHSALVMSSNWGILPEFITPQENTILDFHPEYIASPSAGYPLPMSMTAITTFDGQLTLDTVITTEGHQEALASTMQQVLL